jgi:hypothetical protein
MNWLSTTITILNLVPAIITAMKALEEAIPVPGQGDQKSAAIRAILEATNDKIDVYWPLIQKTINVLAGLFNKTGIWQKAA